MFLAGSLPLTGILHLRMLGLLGMIARLGPDSILQQHGRHVLLNASQNSSCSSWFITIRSISQQYSLPDPLIVMQSPPTQYHWKSLTKAKVLDWWQVKLRGEAAHLDSLEYFKPCFMSLSSPHPLWTTAKSPFEVNKAVVTARMLSGRYRTDRLMRHWSRSNPEGRCRLPGCRGRQGSLQHILLHCPALADARAKCISLWSSFLVPRPWLFPVIAHHTRGTAALHLQFLLDPSALPMVINSTRSNPDVLQCCFFLSRTWNYTIHLKREKIRKFWNLTD